jgi:hypothetical protein
MVPKPVNTDLREQSFFIGQTHLLAPEAVTSAAIPGSQQHIQILVCIQIETLSV